MVLELKLCYFAIHTILLLGSYGLRSHTILLFMLFCY